jgi:4-hydroxy-3-polyprenylbenzoate decarboxylase
VNQPSLRSYLDALAEDGGIVTIKEPVEPVHELAAYLCLLDQGPAVLFDKVRGSAFRAVGNVLATRENVARALTVPLGGIEAAMLRATDTVVDLVEVADAAYQQVVVDDPDLTALPVPTFFEA